MAVLAELEADKLPKVEPAGVRGARFAEVLARVLGRQAAKPTVVAPSVETEG
jgi:hypothetical protein